MPIGDEHIAKSFDEELRKLDDGIAIMAGLVESQLDQAMKALASKDNWISSLVVEGDRQVDKLEARTEEQALKLLALRSPVADDLRRVITALKVATEIERVGDHASNTAKRTLVLNQLGHLAPATAGLVRLGQTVQRLLHDSFTAFLSRDVEAARTIRERDGEIDAHYSSLFREILTYMMEDPRTITAGSHLMFIAKNLERIGDHATNIAELTIFMVTGQPVLEERHKRDDTAGAA